MSATILRTGRTVAVGDRLLPFGDTVKVTAIESRSSHSTIVRTSDGGTAVIGAKCTIEVAR